MASLVPAIYGDVPAGHVECGNCGGTGYVENGDDWERSHLPQRCASCKGTGHHAPFPPAPEETFGPLTAPTLPLVACAECGWQRAQENLVDGVCEQCRHIAASYARRDRERQRLLDEGYRPCRFCLSLVSPKFKHSVCALCLAYLAYLKRAQRQGEQQPQHKESTP